MDGAEFKRGVETLYGVQWPGWVAAAGEAFDVDESTLCRWFHKARVPGPAGRLMEHLLKEHGYRSKQAGAAAAQWARQKGEQP